MAVAVGLTIYEIGALAAAGIAAIWFSSPPGQKATRQAAEDIGKAIDRIKENARGTEKTIDLAPPIPKVDCPPKEKPRQPCGPEECAEAAANIKRILDGDSTTKPLEQRFRELKQDKGTQPWFPSVDPATGKPQKSRGKTRWGHALQVEQEQRSLIESLQRYFECGCSNLDPATLDRAGKLTIRDPLEVVVL